MSLSTSGPVASRPAVSGPGTTTKPAPKPAPTPVRVMIVDDSAVIRGAVGRLLDADPEVAVVTTAANGRQALAALAQQPVDVVVLDIDMPEMDGLTALPLIRKQFPNTRVLMLSTRGAAGADVTVRALALGAADYVCKSVIQPVAQPGVSRVSLIDAYSTELRTKVRLLGRSAQRAGIVGRAVIAVASTAAAANRAAGIAAPAAPPPMRRRMPTPLATRAVVRETAVAVPASPAPSAPSAVLRSTQPVTSIVAIASSTGGPQALAEVLGGLPPMMNLPILITQHMPPEFTRLLAERLTVTTRRRCAEAVDGDTPLPGHVYIAPGDMHMVVVREGRDVRIRLTKEPPVHHCRPAADPMFKSIAEAYGPGTLAVVLTGMGADGRDGSGEIVKRGGRVLAQDEASSVVWGMPGAVVNAGHATAVFPLNQMAMEIARRAVPREIPGTGQSSTSEAQATSATHPSTGARFGAR